jgi:hypothetical protein
MALLSRHEIESALKRLGEFAAAEGETLRLVVVGGAAMVLGYGARASTRDVDALFLPPPEASRVRVWAKQVAGELGWPDDWLNDGAKGYLVGLSLGPVLVSDAGIEVHRPAAEQLLAMKLSAWRDDVDIGDAKRLLEELRPGGGRDAIWRRVVPFLVPGNELKAGYAFDDLWNATTGDG